MTTNLPSSSHPAALPDPMPIVPLTRGFDLYLRPPGSKSLTNRALLLAALADGVSTLRAPLTDADDAQVMLRALRQLGAEIEASTDSSGLSILRIRGVAGQWRIPTGQSVTLNLNNAGTATRFLAAAAALAPASSDGIIIDGDARMRQRPIAELAAALMQIGIRVEYLGTSGFPPLKVWPLADNSSPSTVSFAATASSQFISAVMLMAPSLLRGLDIRLTSPPTSKPYIDMTEQLLRSLAAAFDPAFPGFAGSSPSQNWHLRIKHQLIKAFDLTIEPDYSGASYFWAAAALWPGATIRIPAPQHGPSLQGDAAFASMLGTTGAATASTHEGCFVVQGKHRIAPLTDVSLADMPDTAMTAAVLACFASPTSDNPHASSTLRGLRTLRVKETDRLAALQTELRKLGAQVDILPDVHLGRPDEALRITPPTRMDMTSRIDFDTYHDHRMAMALALVGLRRPNTWIRNPRCVEKTYPSYWHDFARLQT